MSRPPRLALGTCPDSWGVWYADDPRQTPWDRFLDEVAEVGCEPPRGEPDVEEITAALRELETDLFVVVEQDMYPAPFDRPKPIAQRTRRYLRGVGIGAEAGGQP